MTNRWGYILYFLVLYQIHYAISLKSCSLSSGVHQYDLSPLISDFAYAATESGGAAMYYFGFCTAVTQGACTPGQAVCQVDSAPHGSGAANDFTLEEMKDKEGVIVHYRSGDHGSICLSRETTINVFCDQSVTNLEIISAGQPNPEQHDPCVIQINVTSRYGCRIRSDSSSNIPVNIFVAVHSHDDVGWTSTVQEYYEQKVDNIISNIVTALKEDQNKKRKFIQVEMAFFKKWWDKQDKEKRNDVHDLVASSQLSFVMGGWVMPDEANPTYSSLINQLTDGHQFLLQEFNYTPSVGWQIDPFGASTVVAEIYKNSTFKGHVIDRIKHRQKNDMEVNKSLQFSWKLSSNNNESMLTHILDTGYCYPYMNGFKFEGTFDLEARAYMLVQIARDKARWTRTPNVFISMGCDFAYATNAKQQYDALDSIFKHIEENKDLWNVTGIQYSDVADYFDAIAKDQHLLPTYQGDFFPYNDQDNSWWTGYFTSRPEKKGLIRDSEALLRTTETLYSFAHIHKDYNNSKDVNTINALSHVIGVNLHHDAITGTEKQHVNDDYVRLLNTERIPNQEIIKTTLFNLTDGAVPSLIVNNAIDLGALNDSTGKPDDTKAIPLIIYNSLSWTRHDYVKLNMTNYNNTYNYKVSCEGQVTASQIIEDFEDFKVDGVVVLFFKVILPPMGYKTYYVHTYVNDSTDATPTPTPEPSPSPSPSPTPTPSPSPTPTPTPTPTPKPTQRSRKRDEPTPQVPAPELITLSNKHFKVIFSSNNTIESVNTSAVNFKFEQKFMAYDSYNGSDGHPSLQQSGAYIFRPDGPARYLDNRTSFAEVVSHIGNFVSDVYQMFEAEDKNATSFVKQHVRIFHDDDEYLGNFIELSQTVNVPEKGKEIITRFMSSIVNNSTSFTDSNGLRFLKRSYNADQMLPIPANYYPTVYASYIQDDNNAIGFIFDRAHGISSSFGNVEVMLHRRCLEDDGRGVEEPLDDKTTIYPVMRVVFGTKKGIMKLIYRHIYLLNFPPVVTIGAPIDLTTNQLTNQTTNDTLSLIEEMPQNVHVLDLKPIGVDHLYLLRLAHLFDYAEHALFSSPVKFYARSLFKAPFCISSMQETSLTANSVINNHTSFFLEKNYSVILQPKQIRTFLVNITKDYDYCTQNPNVCGKDGKCVNIPCGHWCDCEFNYEYKFNEGCTYKGQQSTGPILYLAQQLPLVVMAYLVVVCTYSMRSELRKMTESSSPFSYSTSSSSPTSSSSSSPSSSSTRKRRRRSQEPGSGLSYRFKVFMQANKRLLERTFFPQNLQSHHND